MNNDKMIEQLPRETTDSKDGVDLSHIGRQGTKQIRSIGLLMLALLLAGLLLWELGLRNVYLRATADTFHQALLDNGLVCWLDGNYVQPLLRNPLYDAIPLWLDRSGNGNHAMATTSGSPSVIELDIRTDDTTRRRNAVQFDGSDSMIIEQLARSRGKTGPLAVFAVSRRTEVEANGPKWQRLISCRGLENSIEDIATPSFAVVADGGRTDAYDATIDERHLGEVGTHQIVFGTNAMTGSQGFHGQICEVLIFQRNLIDENLVLQIRKYLADRWNAHVAADDGGYLRVGDVGEPPERTQADLPLSDQANAGKWQLNRDVSDEFDGDHLNQNRWYSTNPTWLGRLPAFFSEDNVAVADGLLTLTFKRDTPSPDLAEKGYADYSCASIKTKQLLTYGYFEVRARASHSAASSSFFLHTDPRKDPVAEIDVYELAGNAVGRRRLYPMNVHHKPNRKTVGRHSQQASWLAPWPVADDFHVFGLQWDEESIVWYVDGVRVRQIENRRWHHPMHVVIDTEAMFDWLGVPEDNDLPARYVVDYLRVWQVASGDGSEGGT